MAAFKDARSLCSRLLLTWLTGKSWLWVTGRSRVKSGVAYVQIKPKIILLQTLITSKTRLRLLLWFFSRPEAIGHLRGLAEEFGESTNSIRVELTKLFTSGILQKRSDGQKVVYSVNRENSFYVELSSMVAKHLGFDQLLEGVMIQLDGVLAVYVVGDYALGIDSGNIEVILVGSIDEHVLQSWIPKISKKLGRQVSIQVNIDEKAEIIGPKIHLIWLVWSRPTRGSW